MHYYTGNYLKRISEELGKYANLLMSEYLNDSYVAFNQSMEQYKACLLYTSTARSTSRRLSPTFRTPPTWCGWTAGNWEWATRSLRTS